jgi:hypothetical protein
MATRTALLSCTNGTAADIRAWAQFIENTLVTTGGWIVTADTGQTLPSALTVPATSNTKVGYRVYRMADALQATAPCFMRLDFGGGGAGILPAIWVTIGTGSNGAGTITGVFIATGYSGSQQAAGPLNCYGSAATSRFTLGMFCVGTANAYPWTFGLERSKDGSGNDTSDGLLFLFGSTGYFDGTNTYLVVSQYFAFAGSQAAMEKGLSYVLTSQNPSQVFTPGDIGLGIVIHMRGMAQQPGANYFICNSNDVSAQGFLSLTLYGQSRTYQQLDSALTPRKAMHGGGSNGITDANARFLMRYD